ncbi:MAG TPA: family 10 glycosylhydrolase, partial [Phnomibacter sp.]|nr:family 10 glycosylhydrolase [Phnomibacter sp.]
AGLLVCLWACHTGNSQIATPNNKPIKAAWLTNVGSNLLASAAGIRTAVQVAKQSGLNTICTVVWNRGYTQYPSAVMQRYFGQAIDPAYRGRNPLQELITEAHRQGIQVIAWFEFGFAAAYQQEGQHILQHYPHWASRDAQGRVVSENGFTWMNSFHPQVQQFMLELIEEVVRNYQVDGIQGDDRLPAAPVRAGYDIYTTNLYRQQHQGQYPPQNHLDTNWINWRANLMNEFGKTLYHRVKAIKPKLLVAHAPSIYPWSKEHYLQDWPTWLHQGFTDVVMPQVYRYNLTAYQRTLDEMLTQVGNQQHRVFPGMLTSLADGFLMDTTLLRQCIEYNRSKGLQGEAFFYFEGLRRTPLFYKQTY